MRIVTLHRVSLRSIYLLLLLLTGPFAAASDAATFPEPKRGKALLYLLRAEEGKRLKPMRVCLDRGTLGTLPPRSFLAADVEPGMRLLWTSTTAEWVDLEPDRVYRLSYYDHLEQLPASAESEQPGGSVRREVGWRPQDPRGIREEVVSLAEVEAATVGESFATADAGKECGAKKYRKASRRAGKPVEIVLPAEFPRSSYRVARRWYTTLAFDRGGTLSVDRERVRFEKKETRIEIPVAEIVEVVSGEWVTIRYGSGDRLTEALFLSQQGENQRIVWTVLEAMGANDPTASRKTPRAPDKPSAGPDRHFY